MAGRKGPRPGTVNNPQGKNQYSSGGSTGAPLSAAQKRLSSSNKVRFGTRGRNTVKSGINVSSTPSTAGVKIASVPKSRTGAAREKLSAAGTKVKNAAVSVRNRVKGGAVKAQSGSYARGSGDKSKKTLSHRVTRARIQRVKLRNKIKRGITTVRNRLKEKQAKMQSNRYARGTGDKSKKTLSHRVTRARIQRVKLRNKIKRGAVAVRNRVMEKKNKMQTNRYARGEGDKTKKTLKYRYNRYKINKALARRRASTSST